METKTEDTDSSKKKERSRFWSAAESIAFIFFCIASGLLILRTLGII